MKYLAIIAAWVLLIISLIWLEVVLLGVIFGTMVWGKFDSLVVEIALSTFLTLYTAWNLENTQD